MDYHKKIIDEIELHAAAGIKECFEHGVNPNGTYNGKPLIFELITEYMRGPKFSECFKVFVDYGLKFEDKILQAVFLDDADTLDKLLQGNKQAVNNKYTFDCAFTPLYQATLLHVCAEYNHLSCAKILVRHGADVDAKAGYDDHGFGGQTPIFHTVNQHANVCIDMLKYLLEQSAALEITVKGIVWGKGYAWESFIPSVNPVSYAMMGLLRQFQRKEKDIYEIVSLLMNAKYAIKYHPANVPNKYLSH